MNEKKEFNEKEFTDFLGMVVGEFDQEDPQQPIDGNYVFAALSDKEPMVIRTHFDSVTFSAKDKFLPIMIIRYINEIAMGGGSEECITSAEDLLDRVLAYQAEHGMEFPSDTLK